MKGGPWRNPCAKAKNVGCLRGGVLSASMLQASALKGQERRAGALCEVQYTHDKGQGSTQ